MEEIGQWITWSVNIPEDGYYKLSMRVKHNTVSGRNFTDGFILMVRYLLQNWAVLCLIIMIGI